MGSPKAPPVKARGSSGGLGGGLRPHPAPRRPSGLPPHPRGKNRRVAPARPGHYAVPSRAAPACSATSSALGCSLLLAGRSGPGSGPPGPGQRPPGLTSCMLASPRLAAARGPLTRPPTRRATSTLRLSSDYSARPSNCPCVSPGDAGHASTSGSMLSTGCGGYSITANSGRGPLWVRFTRSLASPPPTNRYCKLSATCE